jgi:hypothetical protein
VGDYLIIDGLGKRMAKERLRRSGLLDLHVVDSVATCILALRISITASNGKKMMPNHGLMLVG